MCIVINCYNVREQHLDQVNKKYFSSNTHKTKRSRKYHLFLHYFALNLLAHILAPAVFCARHQTPFDILIYFAQHCEISLHK